MERAATTQQAKAVGSGTGARAMLSIAKNRSSFEVDARLKLRKLGKLSAIVNSTREVSGRLIATTSKDTEANARIGSLF